MSGREVLGLTVDRLADLPSPCRTCVLWELGPVLGARAQRRGQAIAEKQSWLTSALLEWGSVGRIVYVDNVSAGYIMYAAPRLVARATLFPTAPVSADAVLMMGARVRPEFSGQGIGRLLVQSMAKDVMRRGLRAVEAFGSRVGGAGSDDTVLPPDGCLVPAEFFSAVGFVTVRDHQRYPRMRLDLRAALTWRADVEQAVERLLAQVRPGPVLSPGSHV